MQRSNLGWIVAAGMAVLAILIWLYPFGRDDEESTTQTVTIEQTSSEVTAQIAGLQEEIDDLNLSHQSLMQENTALRNLNESLKTESDTTSAEVEQLRQQLTQNGIEPVAPTSVASQESAETSADSSDLTIQSLLVEIDQLRQQLTQNGIEPSVPESAVSQESAETSADSSELTVQSLMVENATLQNLIESLETERHRTSVEIEQLRQQLTQNGIEPSVPESAVSQATGETSAVLSEQDAQSLMQENAELRSLNEQLKSDHAMASSEIAMLQSQLQENGIEPEQTVSVAVQASEQPQKTEYSDSEAAVLTLTADLEITKSQLNDSIARNMELSRNFESLTANLKDTTQQMASLSVTGETLAAENESLKSELTNALADNKNLQDAVQVKEAELAAADFENWYVSQRLFYARDHLRRHRIERRATQSASEQLLMDQQELASNLSSELQANKSQIEQLRSDFSVISLKSDVVFDSGSAKLSPQGQVALAIISNQLKNYPDRIISLEGHTDNKPITARLAEYFPSNWELSAARAASAARSLANQGIDEDRIRVVGRGPRDPIASNDTEDGRAANRRIEIRLMPQLSEQFSN